jgi:FkbM family methyltransferase
MTQLVYRILAVLPKPLVRRIVELRHSSRVVGRILDAFAAHMRKGDVVVQSGVGQGLRIDCRGGKMAYGVGTNEPEVQGLLADVLRRGDVFYDIGANIGFFALIAARLVHPTGIVYAFEPAPAQAATLRRNAEMNGLFNIVVREEAVFSSSGTGRFRIDSDPVGGRVASPNGAEDRDIRVRLVTIDELVQAGAVRPPNIVKLDVEGAEVEAIRGMRLTIEESLPLIVCEMHGTQEAFEQQMSELGYVVRLLDEVVVHDNPHAVATPRDHSDYPSATTSS